MHQVAQPFISSMQVRRTRVMVPCWMMASYSLRRHMPMSKKPAYSQLSISLKRSPVQTAPDAKVIGVIDSDYMVRPDWLKAVVPYFDDAKISYVQAPQD